ncbi:MAG: carboxylesterase family protein [Clostridiales bacterium]|jgi:para-nitrobenzyl esterase|nr:carboxylesterase family protein [Clostridiales bacterium]
MKNVVTKYGALCGVQKQGYAVFRGVPYAKAPVGELRWKAPQEPEKWEGARPAKSFGPRAPQADQPPGSLYHKEFFADEDFLPPKSEDCLYLNIWTPSDLAEEKLPVALWIHGGAFTGGFGSEMEFDGAEFCKKGVILVTVNYRLGALGFLAHPWLTAESGRSGNYGILDQIAALKWVYENIANFGGNPTNITVFGQSAGSMSVQALLLSPLAKGMIARAILQSASGYPSGIGRDRSLTEAEAIGQAFTERCGASSLEKLRALSTEKLAEYSNQFFVESMSKGFPYSPCIDGVVLTQGGDEAIGNGCLPDIPYMIGSTKNDIGVTPKTLENGGFSRLYKACIGWSHQNEKLGRSPSYVYYFTHSLPGDDSGAFHSAELWYEFGTLHRSWRPNVEADYALSKLMIGYWTNFIKSGDPNGDGLPEWKPCTLADPYVRGF